jgi:hypothetical protein
MADTIDKVTQDILAGFGTGYNAAMYAIICDDQCIKPVSEDIYQIGKRDLEGYTIEQKKEIHQRLVELGVFPKEKHGVDYAKFLDYTKARRIDTKNIHASINHTGSEKEILDLCGIPYNHCKDDFDIDSLFIKHYQKARDWQKDLGNKI